MKNSLSLSLSLCTRLVRDHCGRSSRQTANHFYSRILAAFLVISSFCSTLLAQDEFTFDAQESAIRVTLQLQSGVTSLAAGTPYEVTAQVSNESWEVWTNFTTNEYEIRNPQSTPLSNATVSFSTDSGEASYSITSLQTDSSGNASTWVTLNDFGAVIRAEASPDGSALASATLCLYCTSTEPSTTDDSAWTEHWSYSHQESVLSTVLTSSQGGVVTTPDSSFSLDALVIEHSWEVWTSNLGNSEARNHAQAPANGALVTWSVQSGDSVLGETSTYTDAGGLTSNSVTVAASSTIRADVSYAQATSSSATFEFTLGGDENAGTNAEWIYQRTESMVKTTYTLLDGSTPSGFHAGESVRLVANVYFHSWEVWENANGEVWHGNESFSPATSLPVSFSWLSGSGPSDLSASFTSTDYDGRVEAYFTMGQTACTLVLNSEFAGTPTLNSYTIEVLPEVVDPTLVDPTLVDPTLVDPTLVDPTLVEDQYNFSFTDGRLNLYVNIVDGQFVTEATLEEWDVFVNASGDISTQNYRSTPAYGVNLSDVTTADFGSYSVHTVYASFGGYVRSTNVIENNSNGNMIVVQSEASNTTSSPMEEIQPENPEGGENGEPECTE